MIIRKRPDYTNIKVHQDTQKMIFKDDIKILSKLINPFKISKSYIKSEFIEFISLESTFSQCVSLARITIYLLKCDVGILLLLMQYNADRSFVVYEILTLDWWYHLN